MGDRLQTGPQGEAQLLFLDETRLVVGPNASLLIDSFVVEEKTIRSFAINALQGAFRFFSGNGAKTAYAIRTPTVTLGIRGTHFDFTVRPDGRTEFVLLHGEVRICDRFGNCMMVAEPCTVVSAPVDGPLQLVPTSERTQRLREFPYVLYQEARLRDDFQTSVSPCGVGERRAGGLIQGLGNLGPSDSGPGPSISGPLAPSLNVLFEPDGTAFGPGIPLLMGQRDVLQRTSRFSNTSFSASSPGSSGASVIPLPGALPLFGTAVGGLALAAWLRRRRLSASEPPPRNSVSDPWGSQDRDPQECRRPAHARA